MWRQTLEYHPVIAYRFVPGLRARVPSREGGYLIQANGAGFRCNHEFVPEKQPGTRRILLFGDSFTAGDGVSNDKRYGDMLEKMIPNLEIYNFGLPGTGTDQQYLAYKEYGANIEHDLLIIGVFVENIRRVAARYRYFYDEKGKLVCYAKPYYELVDGKLELRNVPPPRQPVAEDSLSEKDRAAIDRGAPVTRMNKLLDSWGLGGSLTAVNRTLGKWHLKAFLQNLLRYQPLPEYNRPTHPAWRLMRAILEEWVSGRQGKTLLLLIPRQQYVEQIADPSGYQARFGELANANGCCLHDPLPEWWQHSLAERQTWHFPDGHLNSRGHAALAAALAPAVASLLAAAPQSSAR